MWVKVENNQVIKRGLPKTGKLSTGETVSNYQLLPEDVLRAEGWLPLQDNPPTVSEGYRAVKSGYTIHDTYVEQNYTIEEIMPPQVSKEKLINRIMKKVIKRYIKSQIKQNKFDPLEVDVLIDDWQTGVLYELNDAVKYGEKVYRVIQEHTSQPDQTPDIASDLYQLYTQTISKWVKPANAENAYNAGDWVIYNEHIYRSLVDNNIWEPIGYYIGKAWKLIK